MQLPPGSSIDAAMNQCELDSHVSPNLVVVSSEAQSGLQKSAIAKSSVLQGLVGTQTDLVLPVSTLGLQQWATWALAPSSSTNCFSALSEGLQVLISPTTPSVIIPKTLQCIILPMTGVGVVNVRSNVRLGLRRNNTVQSALARTPG